MTTHGDDFADAHRRHWSDAEFLFEAERWANADQLYGYTAECALKLVLMSRGEDTKEKKYRQHVNKLWPEFKTFADGRIGERHLSLLPNGSPFSKWSSSNRYAASHCFSRENVQLHRDAASKVCDMVRVMRMDGEL